MENTLSSKILKKIIREQEEKMSPATQRYLFNQDYNSLFLKAEKELKNYFRKYVNGQDENEMFEIGDMNFKGKLPSVSFSIVYATPENSDFKHEKYYFSQRMDMVMMLDKIICPTDNDFVFTPLRKNHVQYVKVTGTVKFLKIDGMPLDGDVTSEHERIFNLPDEEDEDF